jgi:hypothetical protein
MMRHLFLLVMLALTSQLGASWTATAQAQGAGRWTPVMVALVDELPDPRAKSMVIRKPYSPGEEGIHDFILLRREGLSPNRLSSAVAALRTMRRQVATPDRQLRVAVGGDVREDRWSAKERSSAQRLLATLAAAPAQRVEGIGHVPAVVIFVRPPR